MTTVRAVRGATTVAEDRAELIVAATVELLQGLLAINHLERSALVSAYFTMTPDLVSEFPAKGARAAGWDEVPMLCAMEIPVTGALPRCIRVLLHAEVAAGKVLVPTYLHAAESLRPDLKRRPGWSDRGEDRESAKQRKAIPRQV